MKRKPFTCALLLLTWLAACGAADPEWLALTSEQGNFSVHAPGLMQESVQVTATPLGPIAAHTFALERDTYRFTVGYVDYPVPGTAEANPDGALAGEVARALEPLGATLVTKKDIVLDSASGIEFRAELFREQSHDTAEVVVYGRVYLLDARRYKLMVVADADQVKTANPQRFLSSFHWIRKEANPVSR